jgi:gluconolactonase
MKPYLPVLAALALGAVSTSASCARAQDEKAAAKSEAIEMPPTVAPGAQLRVVFEEDGRFFEGPVWEPKSQKLFFTAHPRGDKPFQILRWDGATGAEVWLNETQGINGMALGLDGRLLGAQGRANPPAIVAINPADKALQVLATASDAHPMPETNDLSPDSKGGIYFSCPDFRSKTHSAVYYRAPDGKLTRILSNLKLPNGVEISRDGKRLVVSDSFEKRVYSYPVKEDGTVDAGGVRIFFDPQATSQMDPDGMTTDSAGNFYFTMRGGVWCTNPDGKMLGFIPIKDFVSNVSFGGADNKTLFITGSNRVYALAMTTSG